MTGLIGFAHLDDSALAKALMSDIVRLAPKAEYWTGKGCSHYIAAARNAIDEAELAALRDELIEQINAERGECYGNILYCCLILGVVGGYPLVLAILQAFR